MGVTAKDVIKVAENEVGYMEKKSNKNLDKKTANVGSANYTKYSKIFGMNGVYWCQIFVGYCFYTACGNSKSKAREMLCGSFSAACEETRSAFKRAKRYYTTNPKAGDLIFFSGTRHSGANHVGLVYKVDSNYVYTIEGNTNNGKEVIDNGGMVCKKSYKLSFNRILGYGRPKYDTASTTTTKKSATTTTSKQSSTKQGIITVELANVRTGAGTNNAKCKSDELKNGLKKNTKVDIIGQEKASNGKVWYLIKYKGKQGYISSACMKQI